MKKIYREIYFQGNKEDLLYLVKNLPKYATRKWQHRTDEGILNKYLLFRYFERDSQPVSELSIYYGNKKINSGSLQVSNIVPLSQDKYSIEEYNGILMHFYQDIIVPYKGENAVPYITEPSTDIYDPHRVMSEKAYNALVRFLTNMNVVEPGDIMNSIEEPMWYDFVYQTFEDGCRLGGADLAYVFLDDDFVDEIGCAKMDENRAEQLIHRYDIEYNMLEYSGKIAGQSLKWGTF
ncbi:MAG: hypothetical protein IJ682_12385 [Lachnospiraceae bacterium]|nr:hypothetical protein [Lachnospiraceae bacterium]